MFTTPGLIQDIQHRELQHSLRSKSRQTEGPRVGSLVAGPLIFILEIVGAQSHKGKMQLTLSHQQGGYAFGSVGLFVFLLVCLSVSNITQKVTNGLQWHFTDGSGVVKETSDWILVVIEITMLTVQLKIGPLLNNLEADFDEICRLAVQRNNWLHCGVICAIWGQYGGDELPWPRRSAVSECSCIQEERAQGVCV